MVNKKAFRKLDKKTQEAVLTAAKAAEVRGWEMSKKETAEKTAILKENGMTVVTPSPELMAGLKADRRFYAGRMEKDMPARKGSTS